MTLVNKVGLSQATVDRGEVKNEFNLNCATFQNSIKPELKHGFDQSTTPTSTGRRRLTYSFN